MTHNEPARMSCEQYRDLVSHILRLSSLSRRGGAAPRRGSVSRETGSNVDWTDLGPDKVHGELLRWETICSVATCKASIKESSSRGVRSSESLTKRGYPVRSMEYTEDHEDDTTRKLRKIKS